ncbi:MAG: hypothetical protein AAB434_08305 [Planctomycetota bacterium]
MSGTAAAAIGGAGATTFFNLTVGKTAAVAVSTTASFNVNGTFTCSGSGSFSATAGTVTLGGSGAASITHSSSGTTTFNNLTVSKTAAVSVTTSSSFAVSGNYSNSGSGTLSATAGAATFGGSGAGAIAHTSTGTSTFWNLTINKSASVSVSTSSSFGVNGDYACSGSGSLDATGGTVTFGGSTSKAISHTSTGTTSFNNLTLAKAAAGDILSTTSSFSVRSAYSCTGGTFSATVGTVTFGGTAAGSIAHSGGGTTTFNHLTIGKSAAVTVSSTATFAVNGDFTNSGSGTFNATAGTLTLGGGGTSSLSHTSSGTTTFTSLTVSGGGTRTLAASPTVNTTLLVTGSTVLSMGTGTMASDGASGTIQVDAGSILSIGAVAGLSFTGAGWAYSPAGTISGTAEFNGGTFAIGSALPGPPSRYGNLSLLGGANRALGAGTQVDGTLLVTESSTLSMGAGPIASDGASGTIQVDAGSTLSIGAAAGISFTGAGWAFSPAGTVSGTAEWNGGTAAINSTLPGPPTTFGNITVSGGANRSLGFNPTVNGTVLVTGSSTLTMGTNTVASDGGTTLQVDAGSTLSIGALGSASLTGAGWAYSPANTVSGTLDLAGGTLAVNSVLPGPPTTFGTLRLSGAASRSLGGSVTTNTSLVLTGSSTLALGTDTVSSDGGAILQVDSGSTLTIGANAATSFPGGGWTYSGAALSGTALFDGGTLAIGTALPGVPGAFGSLTLQGGASRSLGTSTQLNDTLLVTGSSTLSLAASVDVSNDGAAVIQVDAGSTLSIDSNNSLSFTGAGWSYSPANTIAGTAEFTTGTRDIDLTLPGPPTLGALLITSGARMTGSSFTVTGDVTVNSASADALNVGTTTLTVNGDVIGTGPITVTSGTLQIGGAAGFTNGGLFTAGTGTVEYNRAGNQSTVRATTYNSLTFSGGGTKTLPTGTATASGTLTISGGTTVDLDVAASILASAGTLTLSGTATVAGSGTLSLTSAASQTIAGGVTLVLSSSGTEAPTLSFGAGAGALNVNGTFRASWTSGPKPIVTGAVAGEADLNLLGGAVDITGLAFSNGPSDGLLIGQNGATNCTITAFRNVDFTAVAAGSRHMSVSAQAPYALLAEDLTFDSSYLPGGANVRVDKNLGAGDTVVTVVGKPSPLGGWGQEVVEGGPGTGPDDDADGGPGGATGQCTWAFGGGLLTASPGTGEVYTDPTTYTGAQGYMTAHYNWYTGTFIGNYVLVRSEEERVAPAGPDDLLVALDGSGNPKYAAPYAFDRGTYGRIIGSPWTASVDRTPDDEVIMWFTTLGYIFVVEDTGGGLVDYAPYPLRPRDSITYATEVCDAGYSLLFFNAGGDFTAGTSDDRFYVCGANGGSNGIYVTKCFDAGAQGQSVSGWPLQPAGLRPARSWMAYQELSGTEYLHVGTDSDADPDTPGATAHIFRVNLSTGAIDQEYPGLPGSHVRGGLQILDDPEFPADARIYVGCHEDAAGGDQSSFFSILSDAAGPGTYVDEWSPNACGTGDVDTLAMFDDAQLYFGDSNGIFWILNRLDGTTVASPTLEAGQPIRSLPQIPIYGGGPIWVGNDNGNVFVVNRGTGAIERTYRLGAGKKVRSLGFADDGAGNFLVVAITSDGFVCFLEP